MPDLGSGFSRVCPACGRRVPRSVTTCRCGAEMPDLGPAEPDVEAASTAGRPLANLAVVAGLLALLAVAGYWSFSRPVTDLPTEVTRPGTIDGGLAAPPAAASGPESSIERRAWDAALTQPGTTAPDRATAAPEPAAALAAPASLEDVVSRVMPAVVLVETSGGRGSGFFVRPDTIITNVHVVKDDAFVRLRRIDGTTVSARVDPAVAGLRHRRAESDGGRRTGGQSCYTTALPGSYSHEWFVMLSPRAITSSQVAAGSCAAFLTAFQQEASRLGVEMRSALEDARRAGVVPGVMRDALRTNRLEFDGWDR